ncbi:UDP-N-acetylmuramate dehydrogenase [Mesoflavibacter sp. SCSIO 43206]|uniref:UDP-N-acetylmuramate dehydrogenase n=1 Tax=Mesoflavibacter sp. SCSIO 43206 TaxID=2779362 RepID=UPI001CA7DEA1|nr:UDP-N-acetylmuramate dehydrogenase [Mesoflavibacter sp. SCSIO 43206]UAB74391.1 UDP-N-acetylmuramate dehydrogenase [Mesoflavibacter sp. SCSIO 43206]
MQVQHNISLKPYNTFGIDVKAKHFISVENIDDLKTIFSTEKFPNKFIIGGGSNMLLTKDVDALVIHLNLKGKKTVSTNDNHVFIKAEAGENWHDFVLWTLKQNYGGLENMSLIPGNVGTSPIQNIGAYGVELKDVFESCEVLNLDTLTIETLSKKDCQFGYRNSIFKNEAKGKYIILNVTFKLTKNNHNLHTNYGAILSQLETMNVTNPTIQDVSKAVIAIRQSKLPDPKEIGNSGSFFKNPIISTEQFKELQRNFPEAPHYVISETEVKVPAGWLIETAGFKGKTFDHYGVHKKQALVLVNYGGAKGEDILQLSKLIQKTIYRIFNISIEAEVNIF